MQFCDLIVLEQNDNIHKGNSTSFGKCSLKKIYVQLCQVISLSAPGQIYEENGTSILIIFNIQRRMDLLFKKYTSI